jgi:NitT/TauT family transport system substrate-binding protein
MPAWKTIAAVTSLCILSFSLLGSPAEPDLRIAVNSTTIESFPVFAAADSLGDRIQLVPAPNGRIAMAQLAGGMVDAATGSETQALLNSVAEPSLRIVLTLAECRYRIIARRSAGIRRVADLRGKTVAVTANTSAHYYLIRMLQKAGLGESDIRVTALEGQDMPVALASRKVDAVSIWEPHAYNSQQALEKDAVILEDPSVYLERFNLNTTTRVLNDPAKRRAFVALIQEIAGVSARLRSRSGEFIPSLAPRVGLTPQTVVGVWPQFKFPASVSGGLRTSLGEVEAWVAATQKRQPRAMRELVILVDESVAAEAQKSGNRI